MIRRSLTALAATGGLLVLPAAADAARRRVPPPPAPAPLPSVAPALPACTPAKAAPNATVPPAVAATFGILRRERTADDALPARALTALRRSGLAVPDPALARRLRLAGRGTAWIVPVADLTPLLRPMRCVLRAPRPARVPRARLVPATPRRARRVPPAPRPAPAPPPTLVEAAPVGSFPLPVPPRPAPRGPQPGVAVVALGDVLGGGGGTLRDLVRGLAAPDVTPCAGPRDDLVGVSGVVPDGVDAVFLTATDGSAIRADVADNGYSFLVPPPSRTAMRVPRYLVWTKDGTPHVTPVLLPALPRRMCAAYQRRIASRTAISPRGFGGLFFTEPVPAPPVSPARAPGRP